jgi:hypothetical protein
MSNCDISICVITFRLVHIVNIRIIIEIKKLKYMFFPEWPCCESSREALAPGGHGDDYGVITNLHSHL